MPGITHPYLNVGRIEGGTNTNVVPGKVVLKLDRRMIPEENPAEVEADVRALIADAVAALPRHPAGDQAPAAGAVAEAAARQRAAGATRCSAMAQAVFGEPIPTSGTPLYTDVRLYGAHGHPGGDLRRRARARCWSRNAKRADEHLVLEDLRRATKVVARTLLDLLG